MSSPSVEIMKKHLRLHNKYIREDLIISGISKMKKEQVKKKFDRVFTKVGDHYKSKERGGYDAEIPVDELKKLMIKQPKKEAPKKEEPKPEPKKEEPKPKSKPAPKKDDSFPVPLKKINPAKIKNYKEFRKAIRNIGTLIFQKKNTELETAPVIKQLTKKILSIDNSEEMKKKVDTDLQIRFDDTRYWKEKLGNELRKIIKRS